jgi:hypothetical protein
MALPSVQIVGMGYTCVYALSMLETSSPTVRLSGSGVSRCPPGIPENDTEPFERENKVTIFNLLFTLKTMLTIITVI